MYMASMASYSASHCSRLLRLQLHLPLLRRGHGHQCGAPWIDGAQAPRVQAARLRLVTGGDQEAALGARVGHLSFEPI